MSALQSAVITPSDEDRRRAYAEALDAAADAIAPEDLPECGDAERETPLAWAACYLRTERGRPLDFEAHRYMVGILSVTDAPRLGLMCASQVGKTTMAIARVFWLCDTRPGTRVIYTMHTDVAVQKFSATRAKPAIEASEYLRARVGGVNSKSVKTFRHPGAASVVFFQGASEGQQALSEPADMVVHDELDFSRPDVLRLYEDRTAHSDLDWHMVIGTPTVPGFGLAALWQQSTQSEWLVKCPKCRWEEPLTWPDSVTPEGYVCGRHHVLPEDAIRNGRWVDARRDAVWRMYHVSRMLLPNWPAARILQAYEREEFPQLFQNQILGLPATSGDLLIDEALLASLMGTVEGRERDDGPCFAGIDVGAVLHVLIGRVAGDGQREYLWVGRTDWHGLDRLMRLFNVRLAVIDALPETTKAQEFAAAHPRRVLLAYYTTQPVKGDEPIRLYRDQARVDLDRTVTLDRSANRLVLQQDGFPLLPHDTRVEFVAHMTAMVRGIERDQHGMLRAFWQETGPDHYRHAHNYATVAADLMARLGGAPLPKVYRGTLPGAAVEARHIRTGEIETICPRPTPNEPDSILPQQRMAPLPTAAEHIYPALRRRRREDENRG